MTIRSKIQVARLLAVIALTGLVLWNPTPAGTGRDFSQCVRSCNAIRMACQEGCSGVCEGMFDRGTAAYNACVSECVAICNTESEECKAICLAEKNDQTPEVP